MEAKSALSSFFDALNVGSRVVRDEAAGDWNLREKGKVALAGMEGRLCGEGAGGACGYRWK